MSDQLERNLNALIAERDDLRAQLADVAHVEQARALREYAAAMFDAGIGGTVLREDVARDLMRRAEAIYPTRVDDV